MAESDFKDKEFKDRLDKWQYRIFQIMLFVVFCTWVFKHLDDDLHVSEKVLHLLGY